MCAIDSVHTRGSVLIRDIPLCGSPVMPGRDPTRDVTWELRDIISPRILRFVCIVPTIKNTLRSGSLNYLSFSQCLWGSNKKTQAKVNPGSM
jgi:hypothetical protein